MRNPLEMWKSRWENNYPEVSRFRNEFDRLFNEMLDFKKSGEVQFEFSPSCEISEDKKNMYYKFDIPGISRDQVKLELSGNLLTVSAERHEEKKTEDKKTYMCEICYGSFSRSFTVPEGTTEKNIDAKYDNGVLTLTIPKSESSKAKQIAIH